MYFQRHREEQITSTNSSSRGAASTLTDGASGGACQAHRTLEAVLDHIETGNVPRLKYPPRPSFSHRRGSSWTPRRMEPGSSSSSGSGSPTALRPLKPEPEEMPLGRRTRSDALVINEGGRPSPRGSLRLVRPKPEPGLLPVKRKHVEMAAPRVFPQVGEGGLCPGAGSLTGKLRELVDAAVTRGVDILSVQETKWRGQEAKGVEGTGFKLWYTGTAESKNVLGILINKSLNVSRSPPSRETLGSWCPPLPDPNPSSAALLPHPDPDPSPPLPSTPAADAPPSPSTTHAAAAHHRALPSPWRNSIQPRAHTAAAAVNPFLPPLPHTHGVRAQGLRLPRPHHCLLGGVPLLLSRLRGAEGPRRHGQESLALRGRTRDLLPRACDNSGAAPPAPVPPAAPAPAPAPRPSPPTMTWTPCGMPASTSPSVIAYAPHRLRGPHPLLNHRGLRHYWGRRGKTVGVSKKR
ncbi:caskin-1 [Triticum aestivum]|uniref:caskin-1 n=1 Tax=Triticum aestivum TaxID=4565 RepID=UPI001D00C258|nr:caskin-1-like [Triticum aestivum]